MSEYDVDLRRWIDMYPLDVIRKEVQEREGPSGLWRISGLSISSPYELAILEQFREELRDVGELGASVPTDVFVFGKGEPTRRDVTKVGGLPYRPAGKPWPKTSAGHPLTFVAQFRFVESRDLFHGLRLPGDILLIFVRDEAVAPGDDQSAVAFEWYPVGIQQLASRQELAKPAWEFVTCYGVRHRTIDYIDPCCDEVVKRRLGNDAVWWNTCCIEGTKIGGRRYLIDREGEQLPGRFLCTLGSIIPAPDVPYPWVNEPKPISLRDCTRHDLSLNWGDSGLISISIDEDSNLHWTLEYY